MSLYKGRRLNLKGITMIEMYELRYSQNGGDAENGPAIATLWNKPETYPSDCVVISVLIPETLANEIGE